MSIFHTHLLLPLAEPERHAGLARRMREIRRFEALSQKDQRAAAATPATHPATCLQHRSLITASNLTMPVSGLPMLASTGHYPCPF